MGGNLWDHQIQVLFKSWETQPTTSFLKKTSLNPKVLIVLGSTFPNAELYSCLT